MHQRCCARRASAAVVPSSPSPSPSSSPLLPTPHRFRARAARRRSQADRALGSGIGGRITIVPRSNRRRVGAAMPPPPPPNAANRDGAADAQAGADADATTTITTLGLTGSIGMGKSAVAAMLTRLDVPVLDADAVVHSLYAPQGAAVAPIAEAFGDAALTEAGGVCRQALSRVVLSDAGAMRALEAIVHPLVALERARFLRKCEAEGLRLAALDIPLLFETKAEATLDAIAVVSAPADKQRERVLARPGMTADKFEAILARQVPDEDKRRRADFVIDTGATLEATERAVAALVGVLRRGGVVTEGASGAAAGAAGQSAWPHPDAEALLVVREWRLEEVRARRRGGGG